MNTFDKESMMSLYNNIEARIREAVTSNDEFLASLCVNESISRLSFISQLKLIDLNDSMKGPSLNANSNTVCEHIKLVAVYVDMSDVWKVLKQKCSKIDCFELFFQSINGDDHSNANVSEYLVAPEKVHHGRIIQDTHITMAHFSTNTSQEMRTTFGCFEGGSVEVTVNALLIGKEAAAIEVHDMKMLSITEALPKCTNNFVHITVWCKSNASLSNKLPELASRGEAIRIEFDQTMVLTGDLRFCPK